MAIQTDYIVSIDKPQAVQIVSSLAHYNSDYNGRMNKQLKEWELPLDFTSYKEFEALLDSLTSEQLAGLLNLA
jgi:hypothetical protein